MTIEHAPSGTPDFHFVIEATRANKRSEYAYTARSAPMGWHAAQKLWCDLDNARVCAFDFPSQTHYYATYFMVRDINDPKWRHLLSERAAARAPRATTASYLKGHHA